MLRHFALATFFLFAGQAQASFYDICEFQAEVLQSTQVDVLNATVDNQESRLAVIIKVLSATDLGGHTGCQGYVGNLNVLKVSAQDYRLMPEGAIVKLKFETMNGLTQNGVWESTTWTLIQDGGNFFEAGVQVESGVFDATTNEIVLQVRVGGGCGEHKYALEVGACLESYPVQCSITLKHTTNDRCRAFLFEEVRIKLSDAGLDDSYYNGASLSIEGRDGSKITIKLPMN
jgi:hypothetical protein